MKQQMLLVTPPAAAAARTTSMQRDSRQWWPAGCLRRRRLRLIGLPCAAVLALFCLLGNPAMQSASSSRNRTLLVLDPVAGGVGHPAAQHPAGALAAQQQQQQQQARMLPDSRLPRKTSSDAGSVSTAVKAGHPAAAGATADGAGSSRAAALAACMADMTPDTAFGVDDFVNAHPARCCHSSSQPAAAAKEQRDHDADNNSGPPRQAGGPLQVVAVLCDACCIRARRQQHQQSHGCGRCCGGCDRSCAGGLRQVCCFHIDHTLCCLQTTLQCWVTTK